MTEPDKGIPLQCPACGWVDAPGAKPLLEIHPDGSVLCLVCGKAFKPQ